MTLLSDRQEPKKELSEDAGHQAQAKALIRQQRTMVVAISAADGPWIAPVYYVYYASGFYFFSSPQARHIEQSMPEQSAAVSIFRDSDQWQDIQGLQMSGNISAIVKRSEQLKAGARFLIKFPFARPFLRSDSQHKSEAPALGKKVRMFVFRPRSAYYVNNRLGFGQRVPIDLTGKA